MVYIDHMEYVFGGGEGQSRFPLDDLQSELQSLNFRPYLGARQNSPDLKIVDIVPRVTDD